ncbi:hypothetical protein FRC06_005385 [Ceratobasidium sp. 370]|nr:hypothetical protein FRC06_005385 [Ceratobasidium sp. 370]
MSKSVVELPKQAETTPGDASKASTPTMQSLSDPVPDKEPIRKFDFGFVPILPHLRHDPEKPFHFSLALNIFFGLASTLSKYILISNISNF